MKKTALAVMMLLGMATLVMSLVACGGGGSAGTGSTQPPSQTTVASFAGIYSGTYSGADSGTVTVTIATDGSITGNGSSTAAPGEQFTLSGQVAAGGNVSLTGTSSAGTATLTGTVTSQGALAGTWSDDAAGTGAFTAQKQGATPTPTPTPVASFAGVYTGTYSGADSGTVTVTLGTNGSISGSGKSTVDPSYQFTISGQVADGGNVSLQGTGSAGAASFSGTVTSQGMLSGTWTNSEIGGGTFTTQKPMIIATTYSIAGKITTGGNALAGATVATSSGSATTDASGNYTISGQANGSYTVTPTKTGYSFTPATLAATVNGANVTGKNFTATSTQTPTPSTSPIVQISSGGDRTFMVLADGSLWGWGGFDGSGVDPNKPLTDLTGKPRKFADGMASGVQAVSSGKYFTMALKADGTLWSWSDSNCYGQLGIGAVAPGTSQCTPSNPPIYNAYNLVGSGYSAVAASQNHTIALKSDGTLWAWGIWTQVGAGSRTTNVFSPIQIGTGFASIAAGPSHSMAIKTDGTLWGWGNNSSYKINNKSRLAEILTPTLIGSGYKAVAVGDGNTLALKTDGSLWAWGGTYSGIIGDGTADQYNSTLGCNCIAEPKQITGVFSDISLHYNHALALKPDGSLWAWGINTEGRIGDGTTVNVRAPKQIGSGYKAISAGYFHSMAVNQGGALYGWGSNNVTGQGGYNTDTLSPAPIVFP